MADSFPVVRITVFCMVDVITLSLSCTDPAGVVLRMGVEAYVKVALEMEITEHAGMD